MFSSEHNVQVHSDHEPEPLFRFRFDGLTEPNLEHRVRVQVWTLFGMFRTRLQPVYYAATGTTDEVVPPVHMSNTMSVPDAEARIMELRGVLEHRKDQPLTPYKVEAWESLLYHCDLLVKYPNLTLSLLWISSNVELCLFLPQTIFNFDSFCRWLIAQLLMSHYRTIYSND